MSPYENLPDSQWKKVTKKLVNEHPLSSDILIDTVLEAWNGILKTKIADELQIGRDIFPTPYMVNNSSSRKRYASPKAGTELYLDLVFRQ